MDSDLRSHKAYCGMVDSHGFCLLELGLVHYQEALDLQLSLHSDVCEGRLSGALLLLEHFPVITLGASADPINLLVPESVLESQGIELVRTDRGGDATYHGPGQLVGYPIINLRSIGSDVHRFLRLIESVIISTLADFGITGSRNGPAGVWVGAKKICSIGIAIRKGVTYHGFALNINPNMAHFAFINPCGLNAAQITSISSLITPVPDINTVRARLVDHFEQETGLRTRLSKAEQ